MRGFPERDWKTLRRRSTADITLLYWRRYELITDEEFQAFTPETRASIDSWLAPQE